MNYRWRNTTSWSKKSDITAKFTDPPLGKAFKKQRKTIEDQGTKQVEALKTLKPGEPLKALRPE